jgi:hypothetical protein
MMADLVFGWRSAVLAALLIVLVGLLVPDLIGFAGFYDAFLFLRLPASGIEVDIPLIGYFPPTPQPDRGVLPDIMAAQTRADIAQGHDRAMARVLASVS